MICQIIKVRIALGAGALRQPRVLPSAFNVTGSFTGSRRVRRSGLTAGWFFSCLRTVPNKDDMVDNPVAGGVLFAEDLAKMRASAEDRLRFFFPTTGPHVHWTVHHLLCCQPIPQCNDNSCTYLYPAGLDPTCEMAALKKKCSLGFFLSSAQTCFSPQCT